MNVRRPPMRERFIKRPDIRQGTGRIAGLEHLLEAVRYAPVWFHKRNPAQYGLTREGSEPPDKTKCEDAGLRDLSDAIRHLRAGIRRGLVSEEVRDAFPARVWSVAMDGTVFEARITNATTGEYHGFPLSPRDPAVNIILSAWKRNE